MLLSKNRNELEKKQIVRQREHVNKKTTNFKKTDFKIGFQKL